jgi:release factor glutamine methyltransferase
MPTPYVHEALKWASSFLENAGREKEIGYILLSHHAGWSRAQLLAEMKSPLSDVTAALFKEDVMKAATGIPVQHLTGLETFYGRPFRVNPDVLIPRPETEELIEAVLARLPAASPKVADIGTGSGIIAITLALEIPAAEVTATDLSPEALETARLNDYAHGTKLRFLEGDALMPFVDSGETFDVIVSNPPYIPEADRSGMNTNVKDHEPSGALFAGEDGLDVYRRIIEQLPRVLRSPGLFALEIGDGQGKDIQQLIKEVFPQADTELLLDINGKERIVTAGI